MKPNYHEIDEILRVPPSRLITCSTLFVTLGLLALFLAGILVRVPEEATGSVTIMNENAFVEVVARTNGRIDTLFVSDRMQVPEDTPLALIENPVSAGEYTLLYNTVTYLRSLVFAADTNGLTGTFIPGLESLGDLQTEYQELAAALTGLRMHCLKKEYLGQLAIHDRTLEIHTGYMYRLREKENLQEKALTFQKKDMERNRELHERQLISDAEWETHQQFVLLEEMKLEDLRTSILDNELQVNQCRADMLALHQQHITLRDELYREVVTRLEQFSQSLQLWEQTYLLRSPVAGRIQFSEVTGAGRQVNAGHTLMTLLPLHGHAITARLHCPAKEASRVEQGQQVWIEMQGYPALTHGYVQAVVESMDEVPAEGFYSIKVALTNGLTTTLYKTPGFNRYAEGHGRIITGEDTFLMHILKNIFPDNNR